MPISIMFKPQWINIWVSGWDFSLPNFSTPKSWVSSFWTTFSGETIPPSIASLLVRGFGGFELWDLQIPKKWSFPIRINWTLLGDVKNLERVTKNMIDIMMHWISLKSFNQSTPTKRQTNPSTIDPGNKNKPFMTDGNIADRTCNTSFFKSILCDKAVLLSPNGLQMVYF